MPAALLVALLLAGLACRAAQAKSFKTPAQEISEVFGSSGAERRTLFISPEQAGRIEALARVKLESRIVTAYRAGGKTTFIDRALVRTMPMTYAVVVDDTGELDRVDVLSFEEPDDYLPAARWLRLYQGRKLSDGLALGKDIPRMTGSSLTSQALNDGVRRALAIFAVCLKEPRG